MNAQVNRLTTALLLIGYCICAGGCTPARRLGDLAAMATLGTTKLVAEGLFNGLLESDESLSEEIDREDRERAWKQYWRENPDRNPAMTKAFADE